MDSFFNSKKTLFRGLNFQLQTKFGALEDKHLVLENKYESLVLRISSYERNLVKMRGSTSGITKITHL
jgi:hypothetical protein